MSEPGIESAEPAEVVSLRAEGFVPIEELSGQVERAMLWPSEHRRVVVDWRYVANHRDSAIPRADRGAFYLVRSPWPTVGTVEAMALLDRWVRRHRSQTPCSMHNRVDAEAELALTKTFLAQDEGWVRAYIEGHVRPAQPV